MRAVIIAVAVTALATSACKSSSAPGCTKDSDCKGARVCVSGACQAQGGGEQAPGAPGQVAAAPGAKGAVTSPEQQSYSAAAIKAIPEACSNAHVMLASAPTSVGADYGWP